jgi:hypothetical protein
MHWGRGEIRRGKRPTFCTALPDRVPGEELGLAPDLTETSLAGFLTTSLDVRQRAALEAVCTDAHRPYFKAIIQVVSHAAMTYDNFHVLQHAAHRSMRCDGKNSFGQASPVMPRVRRGKRPREA